MLGDIIYWGLFGLMVLGFIAWIVFGVIGCDPLGYTRAGVESLPTRKDGKP